MRFHLISKLLHVLFLYLNSHSMILQPLLNKAIHQPLLFFFLLFGLTPTFLAAQTILPGGVEGLKIWYSPEVDSKGNYVWKDKVGTSAEIFPFTAEPGLLNYNPAFSFEEGQREVVLPIAHDELTQATFISLHQAQDTFLERSIWSYESPDEQTLLLSTDRLADLAKGKFLNFLNVIKGGPRLNTYYQHLPPASKSARLGKLRLGHISSTLGIPVSPFSGLFPEFLLYDRVLSRKEQLKVNTYLAIKYGVTLKDSDYLDAQGNVIWNSEENSEYHNRIAGIGRDDLSGLLQKQSASQSTAAAAVWKIGLGILAENNGQNETALAPATFLLWGDDGGRLRFPESGKVESPHLERKWLMTAIGEYQDLSTQLSLDTKHLEFLIHPQNKPWLVVDRSGSGKFEFGSTDYYPSYKNGATGDFIFDQITWDTDGSGSDIFTLQEGTDLLAQFNLQAPSCSPQKEGQLQLKIHGGEAPFYFEWYNVETKRKIEWTVQEREIENIKQIVAGEYRLSIRDAHQNEYQQQFSIDSKEMATTTLLSSYQMKTNEPLLLDATARQVGDVQYRWLTPSGQTVYAPQLQIEQAGTYQLEMELEGCVARKNIQVLPAATTVFKDLNLYPNPLSQGDPFELRIQLLEPLPLNLQIVDELGRMTHEENFPPHDFFRYQNKFVAPGTYHIRLQAGKEVSSLKLVVQ